MNTPLMALGALSLLAFLIGCLPGPSSINPCDEAIFSWSCLEYTFSAPEEPISIWSARYWQPDNKPSKAVSNNGISLVGTSLLLFTICPFLVTGPALGLLGFGSLGPIAGFAAPAIQSAFGAPLAFRALQSAAMGDWGWPVVNGVISGASAIMNAVIYVTQSDSNGDKKKC